MRPAAIASARFICRPLALTWTTASGSRSPGWISCADDIFTLTWSAQDDALIGHYVSLECEDRAPAIARMCR